MFDNATKSYEIPLICPSEKDVTVTSHTIIVDVVGKLMAVSIRIGDIFQSGKEYLHGVWSYGMYTEAETELPFGDDMKSLVNNKIAHLIHNNFDPGVLEKMTTLILLRRNKVVHNPNLDANTYNEQSLFLIVLHDMLYLKTSKGDFIGAWMDDQFSFLVQSYDQVADIANIIDLNDIHVLQNIKNPFDISELYAIGFTCTNTCPSQI